MVADALAGRSKGRVGGHSIRHSLRITRSPRRHPDKAPPLWRPVQRTLRRPASEELEERIIFTFRPDILPGADWQSPALIPAALYQPLEVVPRRPAHWARGHRSEGSKIFTENGTRGGAPSALAGGDEASRRRSSRQHPARRARGCGVTQPSGPSKLRPSSGAHSCSLGIIAD